MKAFRKVQLILVALCAFTMVGCSTGIDPEAIDPLVQRVADRHDAYVAADQSLDEVERETFLRSTVLLRQVVATSEAARK